MTDVEYELQISDDLASWTRLPSTVIESRSELNHEILTVSSDLSGLSADTHFIRITVRATETLGR